MTTPYDLISGLARTINDRDEENLVACFARNAVVRDGGLEYRGFPAIRRWIQTSFERYSLNLEILRIVGDGRAWLFDARVSGTFEGSPVRLEHSVVIENGKIATLEI